MDEQTQTPTDVGASVQLEVEPTVPASAPALSDEQRLEKLLRNLVKGLIAAVAIFAVIYFFGQRQSHVEQAAPIPDQAVANAEAAVRQEPNNLENRLTLAGTYANAQRFDDALTQLREILKFSPKYKPALLGIGELELSRGNLDAAKEVLTSYVKIGSAGEFAAGDPQLERARYALGMVYLKQADYPNAVQYLTDALKINSGDADAWYALGQAQANLKKYDLATVAYKRALAFVPSGWCEPYEGLKGSYGGLGDDDGVKFAESMVRVCGGGGSDSAAALKDLLRTPFAADALFGLGMAAENDGDVDLALKYYQQELSVDRTNVAALSAIARLGASPMPQPIEE